HVRRSPALGALRLPGLREPCALQDPSDGPALRCDTRCPEVKEEAAAPAGAGGAGGHGGRRVSHRSALGHASALLPVRAGNPRPVRIRKADACRSPGACVVSPDALRTQAMRLRSPAVIPQRVATRQASPALASQRRGALCLPGLPPAYAAGE